MRKIPGKNVHNTKVRLKSIARNWNEGKTIIFVSTKTSKWQNKRRNVLKIYMMLAYKKLIDDLQLKQKKYTWMVTQDPRIESKSNSNNNTHRKNETTAKNITGETFILEKVWYLFSNKLPAPLVWLWDPQPQYNNARVQFTFLLLGYTCMGFGIWCALFFFLHHNILL